MSEIGNYLPDPPRVVFQNIVDFYVLWGCVSVLVDLKLDVLHPVWPGAGIAGQSYKATAPRKPVPFMTFLGDRSRNQNVTATTAVRVRTVVSKNLDNSDIAPGIK
ncbi:hypothetical protein FY131_24275 (plasmid) [Agrobacterium tumefaciens]|nr:hypothetical protein FY131_24275 [Agrobacterium tumefaciens]